MTFHVLSKFFFFALIMSIYACGSMNYNYPERGLNSRAEAGMPQGPGCWAKCIIEDRYEKRQDTINSFIGQLEDTHLYKEIRIEVKPGSSKWVKKKADPNCRSANPDDCLVWCLIEEDPQIETFRIIKDNSLTDLYEQKVVPVTLLLEEGGFTAWKQVVCAKDQNEEFYTSLQNALLEAGLTIENLRFGYFEKSSKKALLLYQKENNLPIGNLDFETLDMLGLTFD